MAAGITQPGGAGTTILFEDDTHADAGGDGSYSFLDIATKFPADFVDLGTDPKSYRSLVSLTNGDGTGTAVTTLKDSDVSVVFDSAKTYSVSTTGRANRFTEFGVLVDGTKDSGRAGVSIVFRASTNIQGNAKLYGSTLKTTTGNLILAPGQTGLSYSIINCIFQSATGAVALGISSTGNVDTVYNVDVIGGSGAVGAINNFGAVSADRITAALNPAGTYHLRTNSVFSIKDFVCIGAGAGTGAQLRLGTAGVTLVSPTWDQSLPIVDSTNSTGDEYWPYDIFVLDGASAPIPNAPFTLANGFGATVIDTTTNASGRITYGAGATANTVKVVAYGAAGSITYQGPFTARVNQGAGALAGYPARTIVFDWPSTATWSTNSVQYRELFDIMQLVPPGGSPTNWVELSMP